MSMNEIVPKFELTKQFTMTQDNVTKHFTAKVTFENLSIRDIAQISMKPIIIEYQNGVRNRDEFGKLTDKQVISINAKSPGIRTLTVDEMFEMLTDEQKAQLREKLN